MKRTALALALTSTLSMPLWAQNSVAMFGVLDLAARNVSNESLSSLKSMASGSNSTSRLGVRGTEDLGGGLSAGFHLEHGILADAGTPASAVQFWDRRSTVSLVSASLGELRAGRDFVPTYVNWSRYDPFSYVGVAGANNFVSATPVGPIRSTFATNPNNTVRSNNALQYLLPRGLGGLEGGVLLAPSEGGAVANGVAKVVSVRLGYAAKEFGVSAATASTENGLTTVGKFKDNAIGGNYAAGPVKLTAAWRQFKYNTAKQTNMIFGVSAPFGVHEIKASLNRVNMEGSVGAANIGANDASQIGLGYIYNLSKGTALYTTASRISNKGAATFVVPGGVAGIAGGKTSSGYEGGVRHLF